MSKFRTAALAATLLGAASVSVPASAGTTIILNGLDTISNNGARNGYKIAAKYWESVLTNNATVAFNVDFAQLDPGVLAQAGSARTDVATSTIYAAMLAKASSSLDASAMASLSAQMAAGGGSGVNMVLSSLDDTSVKFYDTDHTGGAFVSNNDTTYANNSVLKALGLLGGTGVDAEITFSSDITFDFDPSDGIAVGATDFIGVAIHEMGHGLGFVSGVDFYDVYGCPNGPGCGFFTDEEFATIGGLNSTLDLFRYGSVGVLDWSVGTPSYFSIDGGLTEFNGNSNFSSGSFNGDGWQASHWQAPRSVVNPAAFTCNKANRVGIMNPYLCSGQTGDVTVEDIAAMDAMGWNTSVDALANPNYYATSGDIYGQFIGQVPEPSTWTMLILGFGVAGAAMRRKSKVQARYAF